MTPSEAISVLLDADSTTTTTRGDRYFGTTQPVPENTTLPFQVCSELDTEFHHHLVGNGGVVQRSLQLDHFAETEAEVVTLANAARNKLDAFTGTVTASGATDLTISTLRIQDEASEQATPDTAQASGVSRIRQEYSMVFLLT